ncbi:MAG: hypothetical protein CVU44_21060 [Chloroflexi bacterium HGW-Chloroflexi-6]|nr:MAG: hypothetical protein CVU44_21060 [Chloroflexi bacterium HGW-Chloroflexi-6]
MPKNYLTKEQILAADDSAFEDVSVPEWGGTVRVRRLSAAEKDAFEASLTIIHQQGGTVVQKPNMVNVRAKLAVRCIVDENGERIFEENEIADLGRKSGAALDRVVAAAKRLNRMSEADLQEMVQGLKNDQPAASPTA